jgi:hypothetical protein
MKSVKIVAAVLFALPALVQAQLTYFPIATNGAAMSFAFDGTNYLVGIENHQTPTPTIGAQMISSSGSKVGSLISTGRSGIATAVAFDGTNYLLIWEDDGLGTLTNGSYRVYGQFIGTSGAKVGSPFDISGLGVQFDGIKTMAFGGGKYLVTYTRLINPAMDDDSTNRYIAGRLVNPNGTMGSEFRISTGNGAASDVAFDGTSFFVVWREDSADAEIRGRAVIPFGGGFLGLEETVVNASAAPSDNPVSVAFDGTNYMVVWNDEIAEDEWDCFAQRVSTSGTLVGEPTTITSEPGPQMVTSVAFDGENYMAVWVDMQNETNWDMHGQYIDANGSLVGGAFAISSNALNQVGGVGFANGKYLVLVNNGEEMGEDGISQVDTATGAFIVPSSTPVVPLLGDDFNDNDKDPAKWGDDIFVDEGTNAVLTETNGRLEFTGSSSEMESSGIIRTWIGSFGSYTQNWEAAVDIHLGDVALPQDAAISMFLAVVENGDAELADHMSVELSMDNDHESMQRSYYMDAAFDNNELDLGTATTADQQGRLRLAFDASTKILTGSFNGIALGSMDVDDPATSWGMTNGSSFMVVLGGSIDGFAYSGSDVYADNFEMRTGDELEYLLTVGHGSGSGNYTNGVDVSITAATAPSGQVFDHWAGATQYLANAASATTTVAMPAQAVTVTAAYKLGGTGSGDDFDDNAQDTGKWGDDVELSYMPNASLQETNGRLEFSGSSASNNFVFVVRPWIASVGSYTQSWETAVDVNMGAVALQGDGDSISMLLTVAKAGDASFADRFGVEMRLERNHDGDQKRGYRVSSSVDHVELRDVPSFGYRSTTDQQGRLRIAFDASTKRLTASYNGNPLGWVDVDQAGTDWEMTDGSGFVIALGGTMSGDAFTYGGHEIHADNFAVNGTVAPPADGDGNGLPDAWERLYFGAPGVDPNAICANGCNTIQQAYVAGFSPVDSSASFIITEINGKRIEWEAVSNRVYTVYWSTNLLNGFQILESNYVGGSFTDTLHGAAGRCFYKLDVRLQP